MGCCCAIKNQRYAFKSSYDEAWEVFIRSQLSKQERFKSNRMRIFNFLFLSIVIPYQVHIRAKLDQMISLMSGDRVEGLKFARNERNVVNEELKEHGQDYRKFLQQMISIKSNIQPQQQQSLGQDPAGVEIKDSNKATVNEQEYQTMQIGIAMKAEVQNPYLSFHSRRKQQMAEESRRISSEIGEAASFQLRGSNLSYTLPRSISDIGRSYEEKGIDESREINFKQIQLEMMNETSASLFTRVIALGKEIEGVRKENDFLKGNEMKYQEMEKKKGEIQANYQLEKSCLQFEVTRLETQVKDYKTELQGIKNKKQELSQLNKTLNEKLLSFTASSLDSSRQKGEKCKLVSHVVEQIIDLSSLSSMAKSQSQNSANIHRSFIIIQKQQLSASQGKIKERNYAILFNLFPNSKILPGHTEFQLAVGIRTIISEMFPLHLTRSEVLFSFDTLTPIHYNKYISDKENLLILIKLENGIIIGGFAGKFIENNQLSQSLLFSISPEREPMVLTTKKKIKRIDYDSSYLIFGSGEIKIKARTLQFTCNLGNFQSIYSLVNRAVPVDKFLGTSQRNLTMQGYQIHQIFFDSLQL